MIFNWFRKRDEQDDETRQLSDALFGPTALALALMQVSQKHMQALSQLGERRPAYKREGSSVIQIWRATRIEFYAIMLVHGANLPLLGDLREQRELFQMFSDQKTHLTIPIEKYDNEPESIVTLRSIMPAYQFLSEAGTVCADKATDRKWLEIEGKTILSELESAVLVTRAELEALLNRTSDRRDAQLPKTMIELIDRDVLEKTKSIALSTKYGPYYATSLDHFEAIVREKHGDQVARQFRAGVEEVIEANSPDELADT